MGVEQEGVLSKINNAMRDMGRSFSSMSTGYTLDNINSKEDPQVRSENVLSVKASGTPTASPSHAPRVKLHRQLSPSAGPTHASSQHTCAECISLHGSQHDAFAGGHCFAYARSERRPIGSTFAGPRSAPQPRFVCTGVTASQAPSAFCPGTSASCGHKERLVPVYEINVQSINEHPCSTGSRRERNKRVHIMALVKHGPFTREKILTWHLFQCGFARSCALMGSMFDEDRNIKDARPSTSRYPTRRHQRDGPIQFKRYTAGSPRGGVWAGRMTMNTQYLRVVAWVDETTELTVQLQKDLEVLIERFNSGTNNAVLMQMGFTARQLQSCDAYGTAALILYSGKSQVRKDNHPDASIFYALPPFTVEVACDDGVVDGLAEGMRSEVRKCERGRCCCSRMGTYRGCIGTNPNSALPLGSPRLSKRPARVPGSAWYLTAVAPAAAPLTYPRCCVLGCYVQNGTWNYCMEKFAEAMNLLSGEVSYETSGAGIFRQIFDQIEDRHRAIEVLKCLFQVQHTCPRATASPPQFLPTPDRRVGVSSLRLQLSLRYYLPPESGRTGSD